MFLRGRHWISPCLALMPLVACGPTSVDAAPPEKKPAVEQPKAQPGDIEQRAYQLRELDRVEVKVDGHAFQAWLMDSDPKREEGFMWVRDSAVKDNEGMIFAFPSAEQRGFWMKDCYMGLDVAYFGADKKLLNVADGIPGNETSLPSAGPAMYVLEVKAGTFKKLGISAGAKLEVPESVMAVQ
jgi:uncharacterized membrane protein (UPF0127 family)